MYALLICFTCFLLLSLQKHMHIQRLSMYRSFQLLCALRLALFSSWRIPLLSGDAAHDAFTVFA